MKFYEKLYDYETVLRLYKRLRSVVVKLDIGPLLVYTAAVHAPIESSMFYRDLRRNNASEVHRVLVTNFGHWELNTSRSDVWDKIVTEYPTILVDDDSKVEDSFPWTLNITEITCYTLESSPPANISDMDYDRVRRLAQERTVIRAVPRVFLGEMSTSVAVTIVAKKAVPPSPPPPRGPDAQSRPHTPPDNKQDQKKSYFTAGTDFKPVTLKDYIRGPKCRPENKPESDRASSEPHDEPPAGPATATGPFASLGICVYIDVPPLHFNLKQDQVHTISAAIHCFSHILALLSNSKTPLRTPRDYPGRPASAPLLRPQSEQRGSSEETPSENPSEQLIPIFESHSVAHGQTRGLKTYFWVQCVISQVSVTYIGGSVKIALNIDDVLGTIDLQEAYEQIRLKISSCTINHFQRDVTTEDAPWEKGALGGRILEMRDTDDGKSVNFFQVTITRARSANMPPNWKDELNLKSFRQNNRDDSMWEVSVSSAPLEVMIDADIFGTLSIIMSSIFISEFCPVQLTKSIPTIQMPFFHMELGAIRITIHVLSEGEIDDVLVINIDDIRSLPYPDNPICRRSINSIGEAGWIPAASGRDGRQHELIVKGFTLHSTKLNLLLPKIEEARARKESNVNPAVNWANAIPAVTMTPIIHRMDVQAVFAPPVYSDGVLACGPALEINVHNDVNIEICTEHMLLAKNAYRQMYLASVLMSLRYSRPKCTIWSKSWCPFSHMVVFDEETHIEANEEDPSGSKTPPLGPFDHVELFMVLGRIDIAYYAKEDPEYEKIDRLRLPSPLPPQDKESTPNVTIVIDSGKAGSSRREPEPESAAGSRSLTETARVADVGRSRLDTVGETATKFARKAPDCIPLLHVTLHQPNMYYWRKLNVTGMQMSLFDAWVALGEGQELGKVWHQTFLSTRSGSPDPETEIPPSLISIRLDTCPSTCMTGDTPGEAWTMEVDIERPVVFDFIDDTLLRFRTIIDMTRCMMGRYYPHSDMEINIWNSLRDNILRYRLEKVTVKSGQLAARWGGVTLACEGTSAQLGCARRPDRLSARVLLTAFTATAEEDAPKHKRHVLLQPVTIGAQAEVAWDAWRAGDHAEAPPNATVRCAIHVDEMALDVRPRDIDSVGYIFEKVQEFIVSVIDDLMWKTRYYQEETREELEADGVVLPDEPPDNPPIHDIDLDYFDDLRSGAFKIILGSGARMPMAYEVSVRASTVVWQYPMPRSIVTIVTSPLPDCDEEVECVLECFNPLLDRWETIAYFKIPTRHTTTYNLCRTDADKVFAYTWRVQVVPDKDETSEPYNFLPSAYAPRDDPNVRFATPMERWSAQGRVQGEQLVGALRFDSVLSTRLAPSLHVTLRCNSFAFHAYNNMPPNEEPSESDDPPVPGFDGIYVGKMLRHSHRVLSFTMRDAAINALESDSLKTMTFDGNFGVDVYESETGTMESLVEECFVQGVVSKADRVDLRVRTGDVRMRINVPRVHTITSLFQEWKPAFKYIRKLSWRYEIPAVPPAPKITYEPYDENSLLQWQLDREKKINASKNLEGRVYLFIVNSCDVPLRVGQNGTDECIILGASTTLAYRWYSPIAPKKLRFARAEPEIGFQWSKSAAFVPLKQAIRLMDPGETQQNNAYPLFLNMNIEDTGSKKLVHIGGRLLLANMLRLDLSYRVRVLDPPEGAACAEAMAERMLPVAAGELLAESAGTSVLLPSGFQDAYIKIKFSCQPNGWTGDIPLKPCPRENIPWLVKVPSMGEVTCVSLWCRVLHTRNDDRLTVVFWPMFMLFNHLPLDVELAMTTESPEPLPVLTQRALGRGHSVQLLLPGTTTACHSLNFRYSVNNECPLTREPVPLHYGLTDRPVFERYRPPAEANLVIEECMDWLKKAGSSPATGWPYSVVRDHWPTHWHPVETQGRSEVLVQYEPLRCGGGACGLLAHLMPRVMMCNATPLELVVRAEDGTPLSRLLPGYVNSPPASMLKSGFHIGVVDKTNLFVSGEQRVSEEELGPYGKPSPGTIAPDHNNKLVVHCDQKLALLTLYYSMHRSIHVFGVSSTYLFINKMSSDVYICPMANVYSPVKPAVLVPPAFTMISPHEDSLSEGHRVDFFWLATPRASLVLQDLSLYIVLTLKFDNDGDGMRYAIPFSLDGPQRTPLALVDAVGIKKSCVVVRQEHEGRVVVTLAPDPRPQCLIRNCTPVTLAIAETSGNECGNQAKPECIGVKHVFKLEPHHSSFYSLSNYMVSSNIKMPSEDVLAKPRQPAFIVGYVNSQNWVGWGQPFELKEGEQLVRLQGQHSIKVCVKLFPHHSLVMLNRIENNDLLPIQIRDRLEENSVEYETKLIKLEPISTNKNERTAKMVDSVYLRTKKRNGTEGEPSGQDSNSSPAREEIVPEAPSNVTITQMDFESETSVISHEIDENWEEGGAVGPQSAWMRVVTGRVVLEMAHSCSSVPLVRAALERVAFLWNEDSQVLLDSMKKVRVVLSVGELQVDNPQHKLQRFDFPVVASTSSTPLPDERFPSLWGMLADDPAFAAKAAVAKIVLRTDFEKWNVLEDDYLELREVELQCAPVSLYIEDTLVRSVSELARMMAPPPPLDSSAVLFGRMRSLAHPLCLRRLRVHRLDITLTLHTAYRLYIALDKSPLRMSPFFLEDLVTSPETLMHYLTVHYLSGAILGAGWVVGGLELLGAPGALAARVANASGGVGGVASTAAAALLRSMNACASSLARNLDMLAGDPEHIERATAARRVTPPTFLSGVIVGIQNFGINLLGAVGGLAHHPLVGVAVGETNGAAALRRGLVGALAKPLSATADLVAFAGQGLLTQTGWDPDPQERSVGENAARSMWQRDCVRWRLRLLSLGVIYGVEAIFEGASKHLLVTEKFLVVAEPTTERIVEMIDFRFCKIISYTTEDVVLHVTQRRPHKVPSEPVRSGYLEEELRSEMLSPAMMRAAQYAGAPTGTTGSVVEVHAPPYHGTALAAAIALAITHARPTHLHLL